DRSLDLEAVHAERAVSGERDDLLAGLRDLRADRVRHGDAHASVRAGVDAVAGHERRNRLSREVQRVVTVDTQDRVPLHESPDLVAEPERMDWRRVAREQRLHLLRLLPVDITQMADPRRLLRPVPGSFRFREKL